MRRFLVLASLIVFLVPAVAPAAEPPAPGKGISVIPDPDSVRRSESGNLAELGTVQPGQPVRDAVLVRSTLDDPAEIHLYGADALPAVGGGFGFTARADEQEQVGAWLRLTQDRLVVPPGGEVEISYELTVPPGTEGGEYVGAVVAEPVSGQAGAGIQTTTRFAMAVYLRVPGGLPGATPGRGSPDGELVFEALDPGFDGRRACPIVSYRNDSQDIVDPVATVTTHGPLGGSSYRRERTGALLPGARADVVLPCVERPVGPGRVEVDLTSPRGGGRESSSYTWLPWPFVASLILLLILIGALLSTFLRGVGRRRGPEREEDSAERVLI